MDRHAVSQMSEQLRIDVAAVQDVPGIRDIVASAYSKYIERIGKLPAPMTADYERLVQEGRMFVLKKGEQLLGAILIAREGDAITVGNLCVAPAAQGKGYGRLLMEHAEKMARALHLAAVTLYTNEKMHENIALYSKLGFVEVDRRTADGYARVYFRKALP